MRDADFQRWANDLDIAVPEFLWPAAQVQRCYDVIPRRLAASIDRAATLAHMGKHDEAEQLRARAGYGGLT